MARRKPGVSVEESQSSLDVFFFQAEDGIRDIGGDWSSDVCSSDLCKYLHRAVDKEGRTIEFMLSAKRDESAAKRFFKKMMRAEHRRLPFSISVDKNAAYPEAFNASQAETIVPKDCQLRRVKYLNNVIEQDHRFIKKKVRASQCFKRFHAAERTLEGIEAMNMMRKGQVKRVSRGDAQGQAKFVASLFRIA